MQVASKEVNVTLSAASSSTLGNGLLTDKTIYPDVLADAPAWVQGPFTSTQSSELVLQLSGIT